MTEVTNGSTLQRGRLIMLLFVFAATLPVLLAGCGSTKVYTVQKNVTYNGALYNVSNVKVISSRVEARLKDGTVLDLKSADKKSFGAHVGQYGALPVRMVILMDDQELVYAANTFDSYSAFDKKRKSFANAQKSLSKFMADKKKTQLKLK